MLSLFPKIRSSWTWETLSELPVFMELDWLYRFSLCVSGYEFVWQSLEDSPSPSYSSQTLKRQREKLVPPLLGDLPLPRGAESTDLLPALLSERATEEKRAWLRCRKQGSSDGFSFYQNWVCLSGRFWPPAHLPACRSASRRSLCCWRSCLFMPEP